MGPMTSNSPESAKPHPYSAHSEPAAPSAPISTAACPHPKPFISETAGLIAGTAAGTLVGSTIIGASSGAWAGPAGVVLGGLVGLGFSVGVTSGIQALWR